MRLRHQIILISLSLLIVPWGGYTFIGELEKALRQNHLQLLEHTATLAANQLQHSQLINTIPQISNEEEVLYSPPFSGTQILDGYSDDWPSGKAGLQRSKNDDSLRFMAARKENDLLLFIEVIDHDIRYKIPGIDNQADGIVLSVPDPSQPEKRVEIALTAIAPGPIKAIVNKEVPWRQNDSSHSHDNLAVIAAWQDTGIGYTIEARLPLQWATSGLQISTIASKTGAQIPFSKVTIEDRAIVNKLSPFTTNNVRLQVTNAQGWMIASAGTIRQETEFSDESPQAWFADALSTLLRWIILEQPKSAAIENVRGQDLSDITQKSLTTASPTNGWYSADYSRDALSVVVLPLYSLGDGTGERTLVGSIRIEQLTHVMASLSNQMIFGLLGTSILVFVGISALLISYVSWISFRISNLKKQVLLSMNAEGQVTAQFQAMSAKDEIGELSRQFAQLFQAVEGYTDYLETFSQKLVHEIRTPVAVVSSSLDILSHAPLDEEESAVYRQRAQDGVSRISHIINALREATRLEKSIENTEKQTFSLSDVLSEIFQAYQSLDSAHQLSLSLPDNPCLLHGSPELIAQLLDKLFENARSYTPENHSIRFKLATRQNQIRLAIENEGSLLPEEGQDIFDSFISHRAENTEGHMGLGLVIVKLIARFHGGSVSAENLRGNTGVRFSITLPLASSMSNI